MNYKTTATILCMPTVVCATPLPQSVKYLPVIASELSAIHSVVPSHIVAGLIEQETCVTIHNKWCWNPHIAVTTKREKGIGLGMLTRGYRNGRVTWDTLTYIKTKHRNLKHLTWGGIRRNPKQQIRLIANMLNDTYVKLDGVDHKNRTRMALSAYNQGYGGLSRDRAVCKRIRRCNPNVWFGNVATVKRKRMSTTAWRVNRKHVVRSITRSNKYRGYMGVHKRRNTGIKQDKITHRGRAVVWTQAERAAITKIMNI